MKLTTQKYKEQIKNRTITVLEEYKGSHTKIKHQCKVCSHIWFVTPTNIKQGTGCPSCAGQKIPSTKEYKKQIKSTGFNVLEKYNGSFSKIKHQCSKCSHIWKVAPISIKKGISCPVCSTNKNRFSTKEYKKQINNKPITVIEKYNGARTKIKHQCKVCNHIWNVTPANIKNGRGCPVCSANKTAYEKYKDNPTWIYYIFIPSKNLHKVGVSMECNGGTKGRYKQEPFEIEILQEKLFTDGYEAWKLEQKIIQNNKHLAWIPSEEEKFGGWTECFVENLIV